MTIKQVYTIEELMAFRHLPLANVVPETLRFCPIKQVNLMPKFAMKQEFKDKYREKEKHSEASPIKPRISVTNNSQRSSKNIIHVQLDLKETITLHETKNAWKPTISNIDCNTSKCRKDEFVKKSRGILNKLTPDNFEKLLQEVIALDITDDETIHELIELIFKKAMDEPKFSNAYAQLCYSLSEHLKGVGSPLIDSKFHIDLIRKCQIEFFQNVTDREGIAAKLMEFRQRIQDCENQFEKIELKEQFVEEEQRIRRRAVSTVIFIGELYKFDMLTKTIMIYCIRCLLDVRNDDKLECLCKFLTTCGQKIELTDKKSPEGLSMYFAQMKEIIDKQIGNVSGRIRFMLQDLFDLRQNDWLPRRKENKPKTISEIDNDPD